MEKLDRALECSADYECFKRLPKGEGKVVHSRQRVHQLITAWGWRIVFPKPRVLLLATERNALAASGVSATSFYLLT